jgi:hypothetical protein
MQLEKEWKSIRGLIQI